MLGSSLVRAVQLEPSREESSGPDLSRKSRREPWEWPRSEGFGWWDRNGYASGDRPLKVQH